jgi:hypothetical protein
MLSDRRSVSHMTIPKNSLYYTEKFVILYQIIYYSVNEFAYNEGLISRDVGFVISRGDCTSTMSSHQAVSAQHRQAT